MVVLWEVKSAEIGCMLQNKICERSTGYSGDCRNSMWLDMAREQGRAA